MTPVWAVTRGQGVRVALIDSGVDHRHEDLEFGQRAFVASSLARGNRDDCGHGTAVASIMMAASFNGIGMAGIAPSSEYGSFKIIRGELNCRGLVADLSEAIVEAAATGHEIVVVSLSIPRAETPPPEFQAAVEFASNQGSIVLVAAGNRGPDDWNGLASTPGVVPVGCTTHLNEMCTWSCKPPRLQLVAPGADIVVALPNDKYAISSGTSLSVPHIAGSLALLLSACGRVSAETMIRLLVETGSPIEATQEWRLPNVGRAMDRALNMPECAP